MSNNDGIGPHQFHATAGRMTRFKVTAADQASRCNFKCGPGAATFGAWPNLMPHAWPTRLNSM
jgi:hypothetical protein